MKKLIATISILTLIFGFSGIVLADSTSTADQNVDIYNDNRSYAPEKQTITNNGKGYRGFLIPAEMNYPGMPSYFGPAVRNHNVRPVSAIIPFKSTYTRTEVEQALEKTKVNRDRQGKDIPDGSKLADQTIKILLAIPDTSKVLQVALITTSAEDGETLSRDVLFAAMLAGLDAGADTLFVTAEGAGAMLKSFGWGIGLSYTRATLSADESGGGVGGGGMGISGGTAGYKSKPWIQAIGLKTIE